ncbi:hypothetical protein VQ056_31190 [Paenibacillus sp. JTLBN-2024]
MSENEGLLGSFCGFGISTVSSFSAGLIRGERWYNTFTMRQLLLCFPKHGYVI